MSAELFFETIAIIYFILHLFLFAGLKNSLSLKKNIFHSLPFVSVIVAARNEESNIESCIQSLSEIKYPKELLEIILVNDNSNDNTYNKMLELTEGLDYFEVINSREVKSKNLKGKANAIDTAIEMCRGEIILSTDADCCVPPGWVNETVKYYEGRTGMVCGFTVMKNDNRIFDIMQSIDWLYLLTLASSSAGLKMILSCVGNNLSFRKKAYLKTGGYSSINFSVTEDLALMRKINLEKQFSVLFPVDKSCLVKTSSCKTINELFSQKRRWFKGGIGINLLGYITGFELYIMNFFLLFGLFFVEYKIYLVIIALKILSELMLIDRVLQKLCLMKLYKFYPAFIIYFAVYGLLLPLSFLFKNKINWKGRKF